MSTLTKKLRAQLRHPFHLVDNSQLPILTALSAMLMAMSIVFYWHPENNSTLATLDIWLMKFALILFPFTLLSWFISVVKESTNHHNKIVQRGLRLGMILFIVSEIFFFLAFFWAFFHFSLAPAVFMGCVWPPLGIQPLDVWGLPLVNTLLLLSSGVTITFAHRAILNYTVSETHAQNNRLFIRYLFATILLGVFFLICQGIEYKYGVSFSWKENVYGSIFFATTGFHGFHVTMGTLFLLFCFIRGFICEYLNKLIIPSTFIQYKHNFLKNMKKSILDNILSKNQKRIPNINSWLGRKVLPKIRDLTNLRATVKYNSWINSQIETYGFTRENHLGFEAAAWYWHFVDVVWLFLFVTVYWWGS